MKFIPLIVYLSGVVFIAASLGRALNSTRFERVWREEDPFGLIRHCPALFYMVIAMLVAFWPASILLVMAIAMRNRMDRDGGGGS